VSPVRGAAGTQQAASLPILPGSAEFDLLRLCTAVQLDDERVTRIANWDPSGIDWTKFFQQADYHGVSSLAARNLLAHGHGLPEQVARALQAAFETTVRRNLWFAGEQGRIARHFEHRKLRVLPYKGPILAESAYGDLALRHFNDLDFLVSAADFEPAQEALSELGYRPSTPLKPEVEGLWMRIGYERAFDGAAGKFLVELQWKLLPHFYAVNLQTEELLERATTACIGGRAVRTLSPEDLLLVLSLHAAKHLWTRLMWIADIAETMRTQSINYEVVISRARMLGVLRIVGVSFWLARNVLAATLSESAEAITADPQVELLAESFATRLQRGVSYDFESSEYFRIIMRLRERQFDRWRYVWRLVLTPGQGDLEAVHLPESLHPLYRLVRLVRLTQKFLRTPPGRSPGGAIARSPDSSL
jgi:hypothetical protein